jgi:HlyD family secretion protein
MTCDRPCLDRANFTQNFHTKFSNFVETSIMVNFPVINKPAFKRLPQRLARWQMGALFALLVGGSGVGVKIATVNQRTNPDILTQSVERKSVPVNITANGVVNPERSINLSPKSAGVVKALLVKEGDWVSAGQTIAIMDDSNLRGQLSQMQGQLGQQAANLQRLNNGSRPEDIARAEAQLAEAEANLQQLRSGNRSQEIAQADARLQQAKATLQLRQSEVQRYQSLYDQGAVSRQILDQKITDRELALTQVTEASQGLSLQNSGARPEQIAQAEARVQQQVQALAVLQAGSRSEDIDQAQAQVQAARGSLETVQTQLRDTEIRAPFDGIVLKKYADIGAFVSPAMAGGGASASSSSILTLSSQRQQIVVNLSEAQLAKVKIGQTVTVKADAIPGKTFQGQVDRIAPQATVSQNVTSFEVRINITSNNANQLKSGMNVEADFMVGQLDNVMLVPNASVVRQAEGSGVYVLGSDRKPIFKSIVAGATVGKQTEVKSGLNGDEQVLVSPPDHKKAKPAVGFPPKPPD